MSFFGAPTMRTLMIPDSDFEQRIARLAGCDGPRQLGRADHLLVRVGAGQQPLPGRFLALFRFCRRGGAATGQPGIGHRRP